MQIITKLINKQEKYQKNQNDLIGDVSQQNLLTLSKCKNSLEKMVGTNLKDKYITDIHKALNLHKSHKKEFMKKRGENFKYEALIGDRKPALDYRK
jgi:hypothetical protein